MSLYDEDGTKDWDGWDCGCDECLRAQREHHRDLYRMDELLAARDREYAELLKLNELVEAKCR